MNLAFDLTAAPERLTGAGHYMVELVAALDRRQSIDLDVMVRPPHLDLIGRRAPRARVHQAGAGPRPVRLLWEQTGLPLRLRRLRPDVLHCPHYTVPMAARTPMVVTFHDATFFTHPELHQRAKVAFFRTAMRLAARRARRIVAVSRATADALAGHGVVDPDRVDVVHEGVDHSRFHKPSDDEVADFRTSHGIKGPYLAFLGTLEPRKNLTRLVRAYDRMALDWPGQLLIAGRHGWGIDDLDQTIQNSRHGAVRRLGYLPDDERSAFLGGATAVCYPSLAEGFGLPVLEAMACGAAVVTAGTSATAEVAGNAAELVDPLDVGSIEWGLRRAILDPERASELRSAGPLRAATFTWESAAVAMEGVYHMAMT